MINKIKINKQNGFTLIELLITLIIVVILTLIVVPSYRSYVLKSQVKAAEINLVTLSSAMENIMQLQLAYPVSTTTTTSDSQTAVSSTWQPSDNNFVYLISSTATGYTLTANGSGNLSTCSLTLDNTGTKTISHCPITSW